MKNQVMTGKIPLFDGTNFGFWKKRMPYYLMSLGPKVWQSVLDEYKSPPTLPTDQDGRKACIANAKALNSITSGITDSEFTKVMGCDSANQSDVVNSLKGLEENIEESTIVQKALRYLPDRFDSKVSAIEEMKDLDTLKMDELHGILIAYEMRKGIPNSKQAAFKASKSKKKGKNWNTNSDDSDTESELAQFV
eukprot:PITA_12170